MEKLTHKLNVYQGNIIGCLWKNPELYADSNINKKTSIQMVCYTIVLARGYML